MCAPDEWVLSTLGVLLVARPTHERAKIVTPRIDTRPVWDGGWVDVDTLKCVPVLRTCSHTRHVHAAVMRFGANGERSYSHAGPMWRRRKIELVHPGPPQRRGTRESVEN